MEKRESRRAIYPRDISYKKMLETGIFSGENVYGITVNSNESGICIFSSYPVQDGQIVKITKGLHSGREILAIVKWTKEITPSIYKAGLEFLEEE